MNQNSILTIIITFVTTGILTFLGWLVKSSVYGKLDDHETRIKQNEKNIIMNAQQIELNTQRDELTIRPLKEIIELKFDQMLHHTSIIEASIGKIEKRMEKLENETR